MLSPFDDPIQPADQRAQRLIEALDPAFAARLGSTERAAIADALSRAFPPTGVMDVRLSFRWFFIRIIAGGERRSQRRRKQERIQFPAYTLRNLPLLLLFWCAVIALAALLIRIVPPMMVGLFFDQGH